METNEKETSEESFEESKETQEESEMTVLTKKIQELEGIVKRQGSDLKKFKSKDTESSKPDEEILKKLDKAILRSANIASQDEVELAEGFKKRLGYEDMDQVLSDDIFQAKLDKLRTDKSNAEAATNLKGGSGDGSAKNTPEYWIAKGVPPTPEQIPDRKLRAKIVRAFLQNAKTGGKKFYNE